MLWSLRKFIIVTQKRINCYLSFLKTLISVNETLCCLQKSNKIWDSKTKIPITYTCVKFRYIFSCPATFLKNSSEVSPNSSALRNLLALGDCFPSSWSKLSITSHWIGRIARSHTLHIWYFCTQHFSFIILFKISNTEIHEAKNWKPNAIYHNASTQN